MAETDEKIKTMSAVQEQDRNTVYEALMANLGKKSIGQAQKKKEGSLITQQKIMSIKFVLRFKFCVIFGQAP